MAEDFSLPVAFHFTLSFAGSGIPVKDAAFQEVSGLERGIELETVVEGGENRFVHQLPKPVKQGTLKLKRGLTDSSGGLVKWCKATIESDFAKPIETKELVIDLLDEEAEPIASWSISNAYPVKWSMAAFDAMRNEIAIETVELAFTTMRRKL
ncbi:phage tail protein [Paracoccus marinaquae]|uniref:Phage tail protein n=1 Tax=Paracoccus marinaquae TaxID=2841926 RepID=A0ABS6AIT0_9RHOB|nr:phage tail protein [Paracoccus marinaquae]MBU3030116.1 phage tail protein [Paracoccus marinaquae]